MMKRINSLLYATAVLGCVTANAGRSATGVVGFADSWMGGNPKWGFYEIPTEGTPEALTMVLPSDYTKCDLGGVYFDGLFMGIFDSSDYSQESVSYYISEVASGAVKQVGDLPANFMAYSLVYDVEQSVAYGSFADTDTGKTWFGTIDPATGDLNRIREFANATAWFAMGLTGDRQLIAIDKSGVLYKVDMATGNYSIIKMTNIATAYLTSGAINPEDGLFYYATSLDAGSALYSIDVITGTVEKLYNLPDNEELRALFFPTDVDFLQAPVAPEGLKVDFQEGSLKGVFSFTMPSLLADGTAAPASLGYSVETDGLLRAQGSAAAGEEVCMEVEFEKSGMHSFKVRAYNEGRAGEPISREFYIGEVKVVSPPYLQTFTTQEETDDMIIINANGDSHSWEWDKRGYMGYYYSFTESADDYLLTPAIRLEAGKSYAFSFDAYRWEGNYPAETVGAYVGTLPSPDMLTECIIPPTSIDNTIPEALTGNFTPEEDGLYYFAIKAMSPANTFALYVDNVSVSAAMDGASPSAPLNLTIVPDQNGALTATISFIAPSLTMNGEKLESISKAEIYRGGDVIATLHPTPGEKVEYYDDGASAGNNTYAVICYGADGEPGERLSMTVFVGHSRPLAPGQIIIREGRTPFEVEVSWDAVSMDENGLRIAPGDVTYTVISVINGNQEVLVEGIAENEVYCSFADQSSEQEFIQFLVYAANSKGLSDRAVSQPYAYGTPYSLPFEESFKDGGVEHAITTVSDGAVWWSATDSEYEGNVTAQDDDNGYAVMSSSSLGDSAWLYTGLIDLTEAEDPILSFYFYSMRGDDENTLQVAASDANANIYSPITPVMQLGGREERGWYPMEVSLSELKGKTIQLGFQGFILKYGMMMIDNVMVYDARSSVDNVLPDASPVEYYSLQGLRLASPAKGEVVIVKENGRTYKSIVK